MPTTKTLTDSLELLLKIFAVLGVFWAGGAWCLRRYRRWRKELVMIHITLEKQELQARAVRLKEELFHAKSNHSDIIAAHLRELQKVILANIQKLPPDEDIRTLALKEFVLREGEGSR